MSRASSPPTQRPMPVFRAECLGEACGLKVSAMENPSLPKAPPIEVQLLETRKADATSACMRCQLKYSPKTSIKA